MGPHRIAPHRTASHRIAPYRTLAPFAPPLKVTNLVFSREKTRKHEVGVMMTSFWAAMHTFLLRHKPHLLHRAPGSMAAGREQAA